MDKKLFAQQMKDELLGRAKTAKPAQSSEEEVKQPATSVPDSEPTNESAESGDSSGEKSFNSQIEVGQAMLDMDGKDEAAY